MVLNKMVYVMTEDFYNADICTRANRFDIYFKTWNKFNKYFSSITTANNAYFKKIIPF